MAPPAKRRRRNAVEDPDDEDEGPQTNNVLTSFLISSPTSPAKNRAPAASPSPVEIRPTARNPSGTTSKALPRRPQPQKNSTLASPKKSRDFSKGSEKGKSADLKTLFSKQAQRCTKSRQENIPIDDLINDPISEEDEFSNFKASSSSLVGQHAKKRARESAHVPSSIGLTSSQRFLKPSKLVTPDDLNEDLRPWSERFGPKSLDELAVHRRKVSDVRKWLESVISGRIRQRLLILKGPAGSGKTTTLRLLTNDMGCEVLEWKNPTNNAASGFVSSSAKFDEFLGRGGKFGALDLDDSSSSILASSFNGSPQDKASRIMLIEEFPNTFSRSSSALASFRSSMLSYLTTHTPALSTFSNQSRKEPIKPVVIIISETLLTTTSASADSFTAHRLLGPEIMRHPGACIIEFNAIAPTFMVKALDLVVQKEARKSGRKRTPGPLVLKQLGELGDIRNAISSLEFLCLKGDHVSDWGAKVAFTKQKKSVKGIKITKGEADSLELISQREASLGIFHAVGKVVYNKRVDGPSGNTVEDLPNHLSHCARPKRSEVSVDSLIDETGTDTHTFISALHENYAPSCESTGPMDLSTPMDYLNECIEALSQSDLLCPSRDIFFGGRGAGFTGKDSGSHILRQDEITFEVAVRGMLFALPYPVQRKMPTGAKGIDAFKMFYPTSLKLWRAKEELEGLVDVWSSKLLKGEDRAPTKSMTDGAGLFRKLQQSGDLSWMQSQQQNRQVAAPRPEAQEKDEEPVPLLSLGSAARREMLLERLPYMAHIAHVRGKSNIRLRDLDKIVSFKGIAAPDEESDADEDQVSGEAWATDKPSEEASPRKKSAGVKGGDMTGMLAQKLVISDDDIED